MMPENETYGTWPASGEIDIAESRGNNVDYMLGGKDIVSSSIHWGKFDSIVSMLGAFSFKCLIESAQGQHLKPMPTGDQPVGKTSVEQITPKDSIPMAWNGPRTFCSHTSIVPYNR